MYGLEYMSPCFDDDPAYTTGIFPFFLAHSKMFCVPAALLWKYSVGVSNDGCILALAAKWNIISQSSIILE